jgi:hypothetical protein
VLVTNLYVARFTGSEAVVELLADGLRRAGHEPLLYAPTLGPQADRLRARGHVIVDRLAALPERPDVIHAQQSTPTVMALAALPGIPAVYVCHSSFLEVEAPPLHPQIRRYAVVSELGRKRCLERGVPPGRLSLVHNAVDLHRFRPRPPLPPRPSRALLIAKDPRHRAAIAEACAGAGVALEELGPASGRISQVLEDELPAYDIVFANGRSALEAAAVGCAVVVCEATGLAGLVTSGNLDRFRSFNFAVGVQVHPVTAEGIGAAIAAYDPADAALVCWRLRAAAGGDLWVADLVELYREAIADPAPPEADGAAAMAALLEELLPSAADRAWRKVANEISDAVPDRLAALVTEAETRLRADLADATGRLAGGSDALGRALQAQADALQEMRAVIAASSAPRPGLLRRLARRLRSASRRITARGASGARDA